MNMIVDEHFRGHGWICKHTIQLIIIVDPLLVHSSTKSKIQSHLWSSSYKLQNLSHQSAHTAIIYKIRGRAYQRMHNRALTPSVIKTLGRVTDSLGIVSLQSQSTIDKKQ